MNKQDDRQWAASRLWEDLWESSRTLPHYMLRLLHVMSASTGQAPVNQLGQEVAAFLRHLGMLRGAWTDAPERNYICSLTDDGMRYVAEHPFVIGRTQPPAVVSLPHDRTIVVSAVDESARPAALVSAIREGWAACVADGTSPLKVKNGALNAAIAASPYAVIAAPELAKWPPGHTEGFSVLFGPARYTYELTLTCACCGSALAPQLVSWLRVRDAIRPLRDPSDLAGRSVARRQADRYDSSVCCACKAERHHDGTVARHHAANPGHVHCGRSS